LHIPRIPFQIAFAICFLHIVDQSVKPEVWTNPGGKPFFDPIRSQKAVQGKIGEEKGEGQDWLLVGYNVCLRSI